MAATCGAQKAPAAAAERLGNELAQRGPPDHNALVQTHATRPCRAGGRGRRTRCGEPRGGAEQSGGASASGPRSGRRARNHLPQQHDKHAGKGPGQHGAVDRAVGGREQHGHPSPATRRGTQGGQGRTLKKARHQMAELMRSHTEETLAALDQAYGEASSDQYERDRRAEGEERVVGTKAATRAAAAAAEHRQEAMQLARSIELHGVEAHLSAAATSLATTARCERLPDRDERAQRGDPPTQGELAEVMELTQSGQALGSARCHGRAEDLRPTPSAWRTWGCYATC